MSLDSYPYITENNLERTQTYQYSSTTLSVFGGVRAAFYQRCLAHLHSRVATPSYLGWYVNHFENELPIEGLAPAPVLDSLLSDARVFLESQTVQWQANDVLNATLTLSLAGETNDSSRDLLTFFQRRFEVKKRIWTSYTAARKPASSLYDDLSNYALLSANLGIAVRESGDLRTLNALLKLNDTIFSLCDHMSDVRVWECAFIGVDCERYAMSNLCQRVLT